MSPTDYTSSILNLLNVTLVRAAFSGPTRFGTSLIQRARIRPVDLREGRRFQISRFDGRKDISTNHALEELPTALADVFAAGFANVHITTATEEIDIRLTKKGEVLVGRKKVNAASVVSTTHNRPKDLALAEDDPFLGTLGIADRGGHVRPTMRDKFTQINEFLKLLDHSLPEVFKRRGDSDGPLTILDCGCGSSHLTLATAHFFNEIKGKPARLVGIDANAEVIEKSRQRAGGLTCPVEFRSAAIGAIADVRADIVLALHACDTATDDALVQAVRSEARLVLAVPCYHKELNARLRIPALAAVQRQGILHQRLADIVTDTFRALLLEVMGYRAEVIEFISAEHTARNLMVRAVRVREAGQAQAMERYWEFKAFCGVTPYLERALGELLPEALRAGRG